MQIDEELLRLRAQVLLLLTRRLGFEATAEQVKNLLPGLSDNEVLGQLAAEHRERSRWRSLVRWVQGLGGTRG